MKITWSEKTLNDVFARVAIEREAFISQFMDRLIGEHKNALEAILIEEQQATGLVDTTNQLVGTVGLEKLLPELVKAIDQVGNEGEEIIDHSFRQGVLFILIAMGAYVIARLIYNFLNKKLITSRA